MTTLYVTDERAFVRKNGGVLVVKLEEGSRTVPLAQVTQVVCCGDVSWSGAALRELAEEGIGVAYVGPHGQWVGRWEPPEGKAVLLRRAQFRAADDEAITLAIARAIVTGKLRNSRSLLMRARRDGSLAGTDEIDAIEGLQDRIGGATTLDQLRGLEGESAARYFAAYGRLISVQGFHFERRMRRPPPDPINAMLSFGYTLLAHAVATAVHCVGFDAHVGFLHAVRYGRESLALDLQEEFRSVVVDALVAALVHKRMIQPGDFTQDATSCRLSDAGRRTFIEQFERKLESEVVHPVLRDRVTHRRAIELQARVLAKFLTGELPAYVSFSKR